MADEKKKNDLVKKLHGYRKELKDARFGLSSQEKRLTHRKRSIRKDIARTTAALRALAFPGKKADDTVVPPKEKK